MSLPPLQALPITVIIPAFNDQGGVNVCLEKIASQSYPLDKIEVIVVDNDSTPPLSIPRTHPFATRIIKCSKKGSYAARNAGAAAASGQVLAFIDADCWPDVHWLTRGMERLSKDPDRSIVGGEVSIVRPERATAVSLYQLSTGFGQETNIIEKGFTATANLFCTRSLFQRVGPFDERLLSGGDREWSWRASKCGFEVVYERQALVYTPPRLTILSAVRQARRVTAGRVMLRELGLSPRGDTGIAQRRSPWQSTLWILSNESLGKFARARVLCAAVIIRGAAALEHLRLSLGGAPERR